MIHDSKPSLLTNLNSDNVHIHHGHTMITIPATEEHPSLRVVPVQSPLSAVYTANGDFKVIPIHFEDSALYDVAATDALDCFEECDVDASDDLADILPDGKEGLVPGNWVIQGAKSREVVGIDWISLTGPKEELNTVASMVASHFGPGIPGPGNKYRRGGSYVYADGVKILFDDEWKSNPCLSIDIPGQALSRMEGEDAVQLLGALLRGRQCTRLDTYIDFISVDAGKIELIDRIIVSCSAKELTGAKVWAPIRKYNQLDLVGNGVTMGERGKKGSGRFVCLYDKGLQSKTMPKDSWIRWETRFSGGLAEAAAHMVLDAEDWVTTLAQITYGAVDFRENNGSREIARRPRMKWFDELLNGIEPVRMRATNLCTSFANWTTWLCSSAVPTLKAMAISTGSSLEEVLRNLADHVKPHRQGAMNPIVARYRELVGSLHDPAVD